MRAPSHRYTWRQYLELERDSAIKHEFFAGRIYAMAGGTPEHSALAVAVVSALYLQHQVKPCRVFNSDLRIRVLATGLSTYPDVSVVCGELQSDPEGGRTTVVNPVVIAEVLIDSTEEYDRGTKFEHYQLIPSFREYVLVSHRERLVEVFRRTDGASWNRTEARSTGRIALDSVGCELAVDDLYRGVELSSDQ